jgi:hypothetical protein
MRNGPRAMSAKAVDCQLAGDSYGHTTRSLRTEVLSARFHLQPARARLYAELAWDHAA